mmetsp:Transcript_44041/g.95700  ORF Transcript_44041/g.95700 Transcript_44041/m.95700 type:complete len:241 (-) Transcript_44041:203-925(-)
MYSWQSALAVFMPAMKARLAAISTEQPVAPVSCFASSIRLSISSSSLSRSIVSTPKPAAAWLLKFTSFSAKPGWCFSTIDLTLTSANACALGSPRMAISEVFCSDPVSSRIISNNMSFSSAFSLNGTITVLVDFMSSSNDSIRLPTTTDTMSVGMLTRRASPSNAGGKVGCLFSSIPRAMIFTPCKPLQRSCRLPPARTQGTERLRDFPASAVPAGFMKKRMLEPVASMICFRKGLFSNL